MCQIGDQILDDGHVRQRIDTDVARDLIHAVDAGQRVDPVDVHRTGSADAFAAGSAEGQRRVDLVLDLDQGVQDHRAASVHVDEIGVDPRICAVIRVPAVDLDLAGVDRPVGFRPGLARRHAAVLG